VFPKYGLTTDLVIAHLMAQMSVETGNGTELIEDLKDYSAATLLRVFPKHFTAATAAQYAGNEVMIGEIAYGGRLGNASPPSTDGFVYRGAGLLQSTGKAGRVTLQAYLDSNKAGFNIVRDPGLIIDPSCALECAAAFFCDEGMRGAGAERLRGQCELQDQRRMERLAAAGAEPGDLEDRTGRGEPGVSGAVSGVAAETCRIAWTALAS
jgi:predicted chitinase